MAEVKQMMGTMKSSNHTGGLGEEELTLLEPIGKDRKKLALFTKGSGATLKLL